jgi:hypothetical protein
MEAPHSRLYRFECNPLSDVQIASLPWVQFNSKVGQHGYRVWIQGVGSCVAMQASFAHTVEDAIEAIKADDATTHYGVFLLCYSPETMDIYCLII